MTVPGNLSSPLLATAAAAAAGVNITKSVRLNSGDSAYLNRTPSSAGSNTTWTLSTWVKKTGNDNHVFGAGAGNTPGRFGFGFNGSDKIFAFVIASSSTVFSITTDAVFRDPAGWYHIVLIADTGNSTQADRFKIYVNGVLQSVSGTLMPPSQNTYVNTTAAHAIGRRSYTAADYFNGYLASTILIDGTAKDETDFGAFDDNGVWQAATYSGTFGTNGFHLFDFASESTVGHDSSGNENDFTANNISTSAGAGNDVLFDVPVNGDASNDTGAGGELSSNYSTMNPLAKNSNTTLTNGNLDVSSTGVYTTLSTIGFPSAGKFYAEFTINNTASGYPFVGIGGFNDTAIYSYANPNTGAFYAQGGYVTGSVSVSGLTALSAGDIVGVAYDTSNGKVWFSINGTYVSSGDPANGNNPTTTLSANASGYCLATSTYQAGTVSLNAGQRAFNTNAPSGFKCLCTSNLPTPTVADGSAHFETKLWTGDGNNRTISGFSFSPDWVWMKNRSFGTDPELYDTIRGAENVIKSSRTDAEGADSSGLLSFTSDGWTLGSSGALNRNNDAIVGWAWDAASSNASNNSGSITSTVRANIAAGFSVITYTGSGSNATIGHGLGVAPQFIVIKDRDASTDWMVYHESLGNGKYLNLNLTSAAVTAVHWQNTSPTSSVFSIGTSIYLNKSGNDYVAYCFAPVAGFSAFGGPYDGTGSDTSAPFQYCGFRPAWILIKSDSSAEDWVIYDTARGPENVVDNVLRPNRDNVEATGDERKIDILSNGFKLRGTEGSINASSKSYIWWAIAENPFQANGGLAR